VNLLVYVFLYINQWLSILKLSNIAVEAEQQPTDGVV
jgi:hypothetical protein